MVDDGKQKTPGHSAAADTARTKALTYADYLAVDELLSLQRPRSEPLEHDEILFIVIHQAYELWFKQILFEIDFLIESLQGDRGPDAMATLKRVLTILKVLVHQIDILETMTPVSFASFRARLESASGFQSAQFRELEIVLGNKNPHMLDAFADSPAGERIRVRLAQPSLWAAVLGFLNLQGLGVPGEVLDRSPRKSTEPDPGVQEVLLEIYAGHPSLRDLCERLVDLDEGIQEWRYRHVKMVERTIGDQPGTGGSPGVAYLRETLFRPVFPDLWAIRSRL